MKVSITAGDLHRTDLRARMPFRYGIATMTSAPHVFVRLQVDVAGRPSTGIAADHLPPKWFTKVPNKPIDEEVDEMLRVIKHALQRAVGLSADTPFDAWQQLYDAQGRWGREHGLPPLLVHFGTSLVERALIEAVCRTEGQPFWVLVRENRLGIRLGDIHASLSGRSPADFLPQQPVGRIRARHTVGLVDPLVDADIPQDERVDDGLPQSLDACIRTYGLRYFKVKVTGQLDRDLDRLRRIAGVIQAHAPADSWFTLDGNEQFHSLAEFRAWWEQLTRHKDLHPLLAHLMVIEQPLHRDVALQPEVGEAMRRWPSHLSIIIDESDGDLDSLPLALSLGYAGTSHKNCKGVFKGLANRCLLFHRDPEQWSWVMSGEDLANIGPVALLQDLAVCACMGLDHVERNGHHYFAGLSLFPAEVQGQMLSAHGDLYQPSRDGWPTLAISNGWLDLTSVNAAPLGVEPVIRVEQFTPVNQELHETHE